MACLWSRVAVWLWGYTRVHRCNRHQEASITRPCSGGSGLGCPFLSQGMEPPCQTWALPMLGLQGWPLFPLSGPEGGSGRPGNFSGILGIRPFRGQGGPWKSPTRQGPWSRSPGLGHVGLDFSSSEGPAPVAFAELRARPGWPLPRAWSLAGGLVCLFGVSQVPECLARGSEVQVGQQEALGGHRVKCSCLSSAGPAGASQPP